MSAGTKSEVLFLREHPSLRPYVLSDVRLTGNNIGNGAYGSVDEVSIPVHAAAKRVHDSLVEADSSIMSAQFAQELQLMASLRHKNVINLLGIYFFPGSSLPALVMERLLTSLHDLLQPERPGERTDDRQPLTFFTMDLKCSVLQDVANGLAYLHERSPPVIHRDLSARNVLLTSGMLAKIADLGVARIVPRASAATMTRAPGASIYMPPEAVAPSGSSNGGATYSASIDIFSFGVLTIFTVGEMFPCDPLAPNYTDESGALVARNELERRSAYMHGVDANLEACGQLRGDHPLIRLIQQCLQNLSAKRPGIRDVICLLDEARDGLRDGETEKNKQGLVHALQSQPRNQNFKQVFKDMEQEIAELQLRLLSNERETKLLLDAKDAKDRELAEAQQQIEDAKLVIQTKDRELTEAQQQIKQETELVETKQIELDEAAKQIQKMRQNEAELVEAKDGEISELKQKVKDLEEEKEHILKQLSGTRETIAKYEQEEHELWLKHGGMRMRLYSLPECVRPSLSSRHSPLPSLGRYDQPVTMKRSTSFCYKSKLKVRCCKLGTAPCKMTRGSATTDHQFMYFTSWDSTAVVTYKWRGASWDELPPCPYSNSALAIINGALTTVGGVDQEKKNTKELFKLEKDKWVNTVYPAMKTARSCAAVVSEKEYVLVISGDDRFAKVELLQIRSKTWFQVADLPEPVQFPSATKCGSSIHVIGNNGCAFSCSLQNLPSEPIQQELISWTPLPKPPVAHHATLATLNGALVIVGGQKEQDKSSVNSIYQLVEDEKWEEICAMSCKRFSCLVVAPSPRSLMIVGGFGKHAMDALDVVEECAQV